MYEQTGKVRPANHRHHHKRCPPHAAAGAVTGHLTRSGLLGKYCQAVFLALLAMSPRCTVNIKNVHKKLKKSVAKRKIVCYSLSINFILPYESLRIRKETERGGGSGESHSIGCRRCKALKAESLRQKDRETESASVFAFCVRTPLRVFSFLLCEMNRQTKE